MPDSVRTLHGATSMPATRNDPLEIAAPRSFGECTTLARSRTPCTDRSVSWRSVATLRHETDLSVQGVRDRASVVHSPNDLGAAISSGSFRVAGMLVAPCSVRTLSGIANSYDEDLVVRAADVTLKERRRLVLLLRETPLHA